MKEKIKQLEHLQPKLIAGALFIHNGKDIQEKIDRTHQVQRVVGDKLATYVMALLVLPQLMEQVMKSDDYTEWTKNYRTRTIN
jgi:hypothetical protein